MPLDMAGSAGGGAVRKSKRYLAPSGRLQVGGLRKAAGGRVSDQLEYELGRITRFGHATEVRVGSGSEEL